MDTKWRNLRHAIRSALLVGPLSGAEQRTVRNVLAFIHPIIMDTANRFDARGMVNAAAEIRRLFDSISMEVDESTPTPPGLKRDEVVRWAIGSNTYVVRLGYSAPFELFQVIDGFGEPFEQKLGQFVDLESASGYAHNHAKNGGAG